MRIPDQRILDRLKPKQIGGLGLLLMAALFLTGCLDNKEVTAKKQELDQLIKEEADLRRQSAELSRQKAELMSRTDDVDKINRKHENVQEDLEAIEEYVGLLNDAVSHYEREIEIWREAHRRSKMGIKAESLTTENGRVFQNVTIRAITDDELIFDCDEGEVRLKMSELSEQARIGLVHEESLKFRN